MTAQPQYTITEGELQQLVYGYIRSDEKHDEWKRREERKHNHPEEHWVPGFINGFLTDRKWGREYVKKLRSQQKER
jgi:hypothetical protein